MHSQHKHMETLWFLVPTFFRFALRFLFLCGFLGFFVLNRHVVGGAFLSLYCGMLPDFFMRQGRFLERRWMERDWYRNYVDWNLYVSRVLILLRQISWVFMTVAFINLIRLFGIFFKADEIQLKANGLDSLEFFHLLNYALNFSFSSS